MPCPLATREAYSHLLALRGQVRILNSMVQIAQIINEHEIDIDWDDHGAMDRITAKKPLGVEARNYELADNALRSRFAVAAWTMAHAGGCVNNFHEHPGVQGKYDGPQLDLEKITASSELVCSASEANAVLAAMPATSQPPSHLICTARSDVCVLRRLNSMS